MLLAPEDSAVDVVSYLRIYILRSVEFWKTQHLFVLPVGAQEGEAAVASTISHWIVKVIG